MIQQGPITYKPQLTSLMNLIKSNTPAGDQVTEVLKSGDEEQIRHMLKNFGNPMNAQWADFTAALPWTDWQISQAVEDLGMIRPEGAQTAGFFWIW